MNTKSSLIIVRTQTMTEVAKCLNGYFLLDLHLICISGMGDLHDNFDSWFEDFEIVQDGDKYKFTQPLVIITDDDDVMNELDDTFIYYYFNEIEDINVASKTFIECGFLPLDTSIIRYYVNNYIDCVDKETTTSAILTIFKRLGYINQDNSPTDKLINSIANNDETQDIAAALAIITNTDNMNRTDDRYINFILEVLRYIDINVFTALEFNNESGNESNNESGNESNNESSNENNNASSTNTTTNDDIDDVD